MDNALTIAQINNYPDHYNSLFPPTLTEISPLHKVIVNIVKIDTDLAAKDIYKQKNGEYSLTKIGCLKLMTAANVVMEKSESVFPQSCQRCIEVNKAAGRPLQCGGCPREFDVAHRVSILVPEPSGGHTRYIGTREVTKQDTLAKKNPLEHMAANCETKALLRAVRAGLRLKGGYTLAELSKPFAVALVVLNTQDPDMKKALIARYAAGTDALFGGGSQTSLPAGNCLQLNEGTINGEVVVVGDDDGPEIDNTSRCEVCQKPIQAVKEWTVEMIVAHLKAKYGRVVCESCRMGGAK